MKVNFKFLVWGIILGLVSLAIIGGNSVLKNRQPVFESATATKGTIRETISASGRIKADKEVELRFQTSGKLAWVGVKEGDRVNAWQAIAQLDQIELQKNVEKALRDYAKERHDFEEEFRVTYREQTPQTALTDSIKRILEKNQWDLDKAVLDVELKDLALKYSTLITPISGIVTHVDTPIAGVNITSTNATFTVSDPNSVIFSVNVDEIDIDQIQEGQEAVIILDAFPGKSFTGKVSKVAFSAVTTAGGGTAFPVEISLPENENLRFKIGMNGDVEIITEQKENALIIPLEALKEADGKNFLQLEKNGKIVDVEVKIGLTSEEMVEIISGVTPGERVIIREKE